MVPPRPISDRGLVQQVTAFLGASILAGVLVAGMLVPLAGGMGLSAKSTAQTFAQSTAALDLRPLPQRTRILASDGKTLITELYDENRITVKLKSIAPIMQQAMIAIEDSRFYTHGGVDIRGTLRAAVTNAESGSVAQGGSTLTQQYVKNVLTVQATSDEQVRAAKERSMSRKLRELQMALQVEKELTKDQILENYLNIAYFGASAHGVEAAAHRYFNKSAINLTLPEAALLAGIVRSPTKFAPTSPAGIKRATARRNVVLDRMALVGMINATDAAAAKATPIKLKPRLPKHGCANAGEAAFFCDYVRRVIENDPVFGKSAEDRKQLLNRGGLTIVTTFDPKMQKAAQRSIGEHVYSKDRVAAAMSMVEPGTGEIRAMAQSRPFGIGGINYNVNKKYGNGIGFQPGSTFKAFVAAAALEEGMPANTRIYSPYHVFLNGPFETCDGRVTDDWDPFNETESEHGHYDMRGALADSINTYFAQLEQRTGICKPKRMAERLGAVRADGAPLREIKSFTLGVNEVAPLDMAEAYATFAARGTHCDAIAIKSIVDHTGKKLTVPGANCKEVLKPEIADTMNMMLQGTVQNGTGTRAAISRPAAGKTGTNDERFHVWYIGYTPNMAGAVWVGNPKGNQHKMRNIKIGPEYFSTVCGGCLPGPIWRDAMKRALVDVPAKSFEQAEGEFVFGEGIPVPDVRGMPVPQATAELERAGFKVKISQNPRKSRRPAGSVAFTDPNSGEGAEPGRTITIFISSGKDGNGGGPPNKPGRPPNKPPNCPTFPFCPPPA